MTATVDRRLVQFQSSVSITTFPQTGTQFLPQVFASHF